MILCHTKTKAHKFIPHICHFFYTGQNLEYKYFAPKIYTGQIVFSQAPPVVPVTNMRYA